MRIDFIDSLDADSTFFFIDPPYFKKGPICYISTDSTRSTTHCLAANCYACMSESRFSIRLLTL